MKNPTAELFCTILSEIEDCCKEARGRVSDAGAREALAHFGAALGLRVLHVRKEMDAAAQEPLRSSAQTPFPPVAPVPPAKAPPTVPKPAAMKGKA